MPTIRPRVTKEEKKEISSNLYAVFGAFLGTLLAFGWTMFIQEILDLISDKYELPELAILTSLIYAIVLTIFALTLMIGIKRFLNGLVNNAVVEIDENGNEIGKNPIKVETKKDSDFE